MLHMITFMLLVLGGLNLGLNEFGYNVVDMVLGVGSMGSKVAYILVGLSAIYAIVTHKKSCNTCSVKA